MRIVHSSEQVEVLVIFPVELLIEDLFGGICSELGDWIVVERVTLHPVTGQLALSPSRNVQSVVFEHQSGRISEVFQLREAIQVPSVPLGVVCDDCVQARRVWVFDAADEVDEAIVIDSSAARESLSGNRFTLKHIFIHSMFELLHN